MKILMVCLGNICRSPMAEGVLQKKLEENNLDAQVDSCGFEAYHLGKHPHSMAIQTAKNHGIDISGQRQRLFKEEDFDIFDKIYVMDSANYRDVQRKSRSEEDMQKVDYLRNVVHPKSNKHVPDPWGGTMEDYEYAFQLIDEACEGIIKRIQYKTL
jgi:protein-tyrosine phosphatase